MENECHQKIELLLKVRIELQINFCLRLNIYLIVFEVLERRYKFKLQKGNDSKIGTKSLQGQVQDLIIYIGWKERGRQHRMEEGSNLKE